MTALASTVREPPAFRSTTTLGAAAPFSSFAEPSMTSILFFFIRKVTPLFIVDATPRERWMMASKSNVAPEALTGRSP
jgi:hypothetical protein